MSVLVQNLKESKDRLKRKLNLGKTNPPRYLGSDAKGEQDERFK